LGERFEQAHAAMLRATESGRGNRAERVKVDGLRADLAHAREHLEALRQAHAEAVEAEQARELNERWDVAQEAGVRLLAAATRVQMAVNTVGSEYPQLLALLKDFDAVLPARARDSYPIAIDRLINLRLGALTSGALGLAPPIAPADVLEGAGNLIERVRDLIVVALRAQTNRAASENQTAPEASINTGE
jgi:hypothetical protein